MRIWHDKTQPFVRTPRAHVALLLIALLAVGPVPTCGLVHADETSTLTSIADSYLQQDSATTNFGTDTIMQVVSDTTGLKSQRSILQFDFTPVPAGSAVKTSILQLFLSAPPSISRTHETRLVTGSTAWTETGVTWNRRTAVVNWTSPGGDFGAVINSASTGTTANVTISWTILTDGSTANIPQGWLDTPANNLGLFVKDSAETSANTNTRYRTKNFSTASQRPLLVVHYLRDVALAAPVAGISEVTHSWTFPPGSTSSNYDGVLLSRLPGSTAPSSTPADGTAYAVGAVVGGSEAVAINTSSFAALSAVDENGPNSVVLPGTQYTYKSFTHDSTTITGAATPTPPHYSKGVAGSSVTTAAGGGTNKRWSYKTAAVALAPPGLIPAVTVVAASNDNVVHGMNATTGARNYQPGGAIGTTGGAVQTRPAVISQSDNSVADCDTVTLGNQPCDIAYVGSNDGRVYAFNVSTGQQIWVTPVPGAVGSLVAVGGIIQGGIAVQLKKYANVSFTPATDLVYVGTRELSTTANKVYALNGSTGAVVWTFSPGNMDAVNSTPAVDYANNVIWATSLSNGSTQPSLWKINSVTGAGLFNFSLGDISGSPTLNFDNKVVYAVKDNGNLVAVRNDIVGCANTFATGATSGTGFPIPVNVAAMDDRIFYTTTTAGASTVRKVRFAYNPACGGETFVADAGYTNPSGIGTLSTPIINFLGLTPATRFIYAGSSDGNLYKIDPVSGAVLLSRTVNTGFTIGDPSLDVALSKLFVGDAQGRIYSFDVF